MKKSMLENYALAVCFANVICFVVASVITIYNVIEICNPAFTISAYEYNRYKNNDAYWKSESANNCSENKELIRPSEQDLTKQRVEGYQQVLEGERRIALQGLTVTTVLIILNIIFFVIHWHIARRAREANTNT